MGDVLLVWDRDLHREVAVKLIRGRIADDPACVRNFITEAQSTGGMEHPGIPPIHDIGFTSSGRPYFAMKLVRGKTLAEVIESLEKRGAEAREAFTLHRLVSLLERVSETIHFAHENGIIHRDLKPENIMLGEFGEVHVMDWGIAKTIGTGPEHGAGAHGEIPAEGTVDGIVKGTIPYMSPEQARGLVSRLDRRSDVYALGCILYEMLCFRPAFEGYTIQTIRKVMNGEFTSVDERQPNVQVPEMLALITSRAMKTDPDDRQPSAAAFAEELRVWLDGRSEEKARRREAARLAELGSAAAEQHRELKLELREAQNAFDRIKAEVAPWRSISEKRELIAAGENLRSVEVAVALSRADARKHFEAALLQHKANPVARNSLGELWLERLQDAESHKDRASAAYALSMMERYADGPLAEIIRGDGRLDLTCDPPDADILIYRFREEGSILRYSGPPLELRPPLRDLTLKMGSYLLLLRGEGYPEVRYPVHLTRNGTWRGHVRLRKPGQIAPGFVLVPGGPFLAGDDALKAIEVDDFLISRYPVTCWLNLTKSMRSFVSPCLMMTWKNCLRVRARCRSAWTRWMPGILMPALRWQWMRCAVRAAKPK